MGNAALTTIVGSCPQCEMGMDVRFANPAGAEQTTVRTRNMPGSALLTQYSGAMQRLRSVIGNHPYVEALRDGRVSSPWVSLEFETVEGALRNAMTLMARNAEFDLCEMSPTS